MPVQGLILDLEGSVVFANAAWRGAYAECRAWDWTKFNYLDVCETSARHGDEIASRVLSGLQGVVDGAAEEFECEYPCHSPDGERWFVLRVSRVSDGPKVLLPMLHFDVTERRQREQQLRRESIEDPLTGILNRRGFEQRSAVSWAEAQRRGESVCVAVADLDGFKALNDLHGHAVGDECLRRVGALLSGCSRRPLDVLARMGGDEFCLLLARCTRSYVEGALGDVCRAIREGAPASELGLSVGALFIEDARAFSLDEALRRADDLLYEAKAARRSGLLLEGPGEGSAAPPTPPREAEA